MNIVLYFSSNTSCISTESMTALGQSSFYMGMSFMLQLIGDVVAPDPGTAKS